MNFVDTGRYEVFRNEHFTVAQANYLAGYLNAKGIEAHTLSPSNTLSIPEKDVSRAIEIYRDLVKENN